MCIKKKTTKIDSCHRQSIYCLAAFVVVGQDIIIFLMVLTYSILKKLFFDIKIHWTVYPNLQFAAMINNILTKKNHIFIRNNLS